MDIREIESIKPSKRAPVSVIIPAYNAERWIKGCVSSVLTQAPPPAEIIVVNDGSTDNTSVIVHRCFSDIPGMKVLDQPNRGLPAARNRGILESTQPLIAFLDADDIWLSNKLNRQVESLYIAGPEYGLCHTLAEIIDESGMVIKRWEDINRGNFYFKHGNEITSKLLARGNYLVGSGSSAILRRECIETIGLFDEDRHTTEDWPYWYRISQRYRVLTVREVLVQIRFSKGAMHANNRKRLERQLLAIQKMKTICTIAHFNILKEAELEAAATLLLYGIADSQLRVSLFRKYGASIVPAILRKVQKTLINGNAYCFKRLK